MPRISDTGLDSLIIVPPGRIELPSQAPQARILSVELRGPLFKIITKWQ